MLSRLLEIRNFRFGQAELALGGVTNEYIIHMKAQDLKSVVEFLKKINMMMELIKYKDK